MQIGVVLPACHYWPGALVSDECACDSAVDTTLDERQHVSDSQGLCVRLGAALVFKIAFSQTTVTDHDAVRNPDQLHVGELDTRAGLLVAIIEQHFETGGGQFGVQLVGCLANSFGFVAQGHQRDLERCQRVAPDDAVLVVVLLDGSGHHARNTDAVAAHGQRHWLAVFTQDLAFQGFAVLGAELEDMPDFNAAFDFQGAFAVRARIASHYVAQICYGRNWQVSLPVHAEIVLVVDVGADAKVAHQFYRAVDDARQWQVQRAKRACTGADGGTQFSFGSHDQRAGNQLQVSGFDFVEFVVAPNDQRDQLAFFGSVYHQCLDGLFNRQIEAFHQLGDGLGVRRVHQAQLFGRCCTACFPWHGFGFLDVRCVVRAVAEHDIVFTGFSQHLELVGASAADGTVIGCHWTEIQAQAREDVAIGLVHAVVGLLQRSVVHVEGVGVLHDELAAAHHAETWADLVAEFGLDLVQVDRQLFIAVELIAGQVGDHFFVSRTCSEFTIMAILDAQQLRAVLFPAPRLLPQLCRLHAGHQYFKRASSVHFLTNDGFDLAHNTQTQREPGVEAGGKFANHAGTQHQLVADHDRIGRRFFLCGKQILTGTHGRPLSVADWK